MDNKFVSVLLLIIKLPTSLIICLYVPNFKNTKRFQNLNGYYTLLISIINGNKIKIS